MSRRFPWKVSPRSSKLPLTTPTYVFPVIWNDIDLYLAYRDFTTDPVRYPAEDIRDFISELAGFSARVTRFLIDVCTIIDRKRTALRTDRRCGDSRVNQQDRYCRCGV